MANQWIKGGIMIKRLHSTFLLLLAAAVLFMLPATRAPGYAATQGKTWALLVGVDQYDNPNISSLHYAEADARGFASALIQCGSASKDRVFVLTSSGKGQLRASRANIVDWLVRLRKNLNPGDTFIFFFSGHGISMEKKSYLLTTDAIPSPVENLEMSALDMASLKSLLEKIPASRVLIAVDACRNDPRSGKGDIDNPMRDTFAKNLVIRPGGKTTTNVQVAATLYACKVGERSYEWPDKKQGFFSYFLIEGLRGAAKDSKGQVTLLSLLDYLEKKVPEQIRIWKGEASQTPWAEVSGTGAGRWVLSFNMTVSSEQLSTNSTATSELQPSPANESGLLAQAQELFDSGKFAEPPGDNVIEVVRKVPKNDPELAAARELEGRATKAYENQAIMALEEKNNARALEIYTRLLNLYPDKEEYMRKVLSLKKPPEDIIVGEWTYNTYYVICKTSIYADKSYRAEWTETNFRGSTQKTDTGTWEFADPGKRKYILRSNNTVDTCELTPSEDNQTAIGYWPKYNITAIWQRVSPQPGNSK